jgi:predicted nucleic acid-binding protein
MIEMNAALLESAAAIEPFSLSSLDAIHLASALSAADPSIDVITYDERLADAARAHGLTVVQPGR